MLIHAFRYRFLLQFVSVYQRFLFVLYILSDDVSYKIEGRQKRVSLRWKTYGMYWLCKLSLKVLSGIAQTVEGFGSRSG